MKRFFIATVVALLTITTVAVASGTYQGFPIINIVVNGKAVMSEVPAINFHGRTLLPVRAVAEALGAEVLWNSETQTATLTTATITGADTEKAAALEQENQGLRSQITSLEGQVKQLAAELQQLKPPAPAPSTGTVGFSRSNPAPVGTDVTYESKSFTETFTAKLALLETVRGEAAWKLIEAANMFNDEPEEGQEYLLARFRFELVTMKNSEAAYRLTSGHFTAVSSQGRDYDSPVVVVPSPDIHTQLYAGAGHEGWVAFQVSKNDAKPVITTGRDYRGLGGVWFDPTSPK